MREDALTFQLNSPKIGNLCAISLNCGYELMQGSKPFDQHTDYRQDPLESLH